MINPKRRIYVRGSGYYQTAPENRLPAHADPYSRYSCLVIATVASSCRSVARRDAPSHVERMGLCGQGQLMKMMRRL